VQVLSHLYLHAYSSAYTFTACLMSFRILPEVLLEGVVVSDHQGRVVAHLNCEGTPTPTGRGKFFSLGLFFCLWNRNKILCVGDGCGHMTPFF